MPKEVTRNIKKEIERELWARAAGRCQFEGCNRLLYKSPITQERVNISEKAHIYSVSEDGPRGWGPFKTNINGLNNIDNLMLMCHDCHKTIDQDKEGAKYSSSLLQEWKQNHELRVVAVTGISSNKKSYVVFYGSNISEQKSSIDKYEAFSAMFPNRYPADERPIILSMSCSHQDNSPDFWHTETHHLKTIFSIHIKQRIEELDTVHFSVFALAPMPLLIQMGALFTDKVEVDVYQPIREPKTWQWQEYPEGFEFIIKEPATYSHQPALVISISDRIKHDRVFSVLGNNVSIWELTVDHTFIGNDTIRAQAQLSMMRNAIRMTGILAVLKVMPNG
ncbi:HNH endonuclease [Desulfitibacter alkalitolerans]|uniref:HNH endonuclease n=1 Tax=Desulfitibacter alkalitolerans TaxID=264641 RepID=UPI000686DD46|nr:SAVED domain-containing protein [Desulfitibacter alkalitolerans]